MTETTKPMVVTGLFEGRHEAETAYGHAMDRGYKYNEVNVVMSDATRARHFGDDAVKTELGNKAAEGAGVGGAIGGTVGAVAAAVAALGTTLLLPGLGLVIAGPLAAAVAGAGAGAAAGGLVGALVGWNMPETRVMEVESALKEGKILIAVTPRNADDQQYFDDVWKRTDVAPLL